MGVAREVRAGGCGPEFSPRLAGVLVPITAGIGIGFGLGLHVDWFGLGWVGIGCGRVHRSNF